METVVHIGSEELPTDLAAALADANLDLVSVPDLPAALDTLDRTPAASLLIATDRPNAVLSRLRRRGHTQPAVALLAPDDPLPDDTDFAALVPTDDPERIAARVRNAIEDRRLTERRRRRARLRAAIEKENGDVEDAEDAAALAERLVAAGYTAAWVARHEPSTDVLVPVAATGLATDHLRTITAADAEDPVVEALDSGVAVAEGDPATLAVRLGDGPFVLVCYGQRPDGVPEGEREVLARLSEVADDTDEQTPDESTSGDAVRVLADAFAHELANGVEITSARLDSASDDGDLDRARAALDRLGDLANEARRLAGGGTEPEEVAVGTVAREAFDRLDAPDASLSVEPDGRIDADPTLLALAFENLFRNATEHAGADVSVTVSVTEAGFAVADDGPGISPEERDRVLEWGYSTGGTGVGLGIVALVAERHGWSLSVSESENGGARFEFV